MLVSLRETGILHHVAPYLFTVRNGTIVRIEQPRVHDQDIITQSFVPQRL